MEAFISCERITKLTMYLLEIFNPHSQNTLAYLLSTKGHLEKQK